MQADHAEDGGAGLRDNSIPGVSGLGEDVDHDNGQITPLYNSAAEKSLSHAEAKLFFQRHQLETSQQDAEAYNPVARARAYSSTADGDGGLSRTTSTASRRSGRG